MHRKNRKKSGEIMRGAKEGRVRLRFSYCLLITPILTDTPCTLSLLESFFSHARCPSKVREDQAVQHLAGITDIRGEHKEAVTCPDETLVLRERVAVEEAL